METISDQNIYPCGCQVRCICKTKRGKKPIPDELKKPKLKSKPKPRTKPLTDEEYERIKEFKKNYYYRNRDHILEYKHNFYLRAKNIDLNIDDLKQKQQATMEYTSNPVKLKIIKPQIQLQQTDVNNNQIPTQTNKLPLLLIISNKNEYENINILTKVN